MAWLRFRSMQIRECLAPTEPVAELMPELDVTFAQAPAQPDLTARCQGREVDQTRLDLAQGHAQLVDPGDARLHPVDDPLHPEPQDPDLGITGGRVLPRV